MGDEGGVGEGDWGGGCGGGVGGEVWDGNVVWVGFGVVGSLDKGFVGCVGDRGGLGLCGDRFECG